MFRPLPGPGSQLALVMQQLYGWHAPCFSSLAFILTPHLLSTHFLLISISSSSSPTFPCFFPFHFHLFVCLFVCCVIDLFSEMLCRSLGGIAPSSLSFDTLLASSSKMVLLDKLLRRLQQAGEYACIHPFSVSSFLHPIHPFIFSPLCGRLLSIILSISSFEFLAIAGSRVVLFSQFTIMLDVVERYLRLQQEKQQEEEEEEDAKQQNLATSSASSSSSSSSCSSSQSASSSSSSSCPFSWQYCRLDGQTNRVRREIAVNNFNRDRSIFIFLISTYVIDALHICLFVRFGNRELLDPP